MAFCIAPHRTCVAYCTSVHKHGAQYLSYFPAIQRSDYPPPPCGHLPRAPSFDYGARWLTGPPSPYRASAGGEGDERVMARAELEVGWLGLIFICTVAWALLGRWAGIMAWHFYTVPHRTQRSILHQCG